MNVYNIPAGFSSFEAIEKIFRDKLPEGFKVVKAEAGGKIAGQNGFLGMGKPKVQSQLVGTIYIKQNSYNGMQVTFTTTDQVQGGSIGIASYVPSWIVQFLRSKVLGFATNLVFPAIYGTSKKIYAATDTLIMQNFGAEQYDTSFSGSMKSMLKGESLQVKNSSVNRP